jgi:hypothetical protein
VRPGPSDVHSRLGNGDFDQSDVERAPRSVDLGRATPLQAAGAVAEASLHRTETAAFASPVRAARAERSLVSRTAATRS